MLSKYMFYTIKRCGNLLLTLLMIFWFAPAAYLSAQDEPATNDEVPELITSRLSVSSIQMPEDTIELQGLLLAKIEGAYQKISDASIEFFFIGEEEIPLGKATTGTDGIARIKSKKSLAPLNEEGYLTLAAKFSGNDELTESDDEVNVLPASLTIEPIEKDSTYAIGISLTAPSVDGDMPLPDADVTIKVRRMIGMLPVGEGTTDEEGKAEITFPSDLNGNDNGDLFITVSIQDFDEYGNLAATTVQRWSKPVSSKDVRLPRALWSPYPPTWLLLTFLGLLAFIWGHYVHIVIELIRVKKAGNRTKKFVTENDKNQPG